MNNVKPDGSWDWGKVRRVPASARQLERYSLRPGDILFNATNSVDQVGKSALNIGFDEPVTFSNHFWRIRVKEEVADPAYVVRYLGYLWQRRVFQNMVDAWVNQATVQRDALLASTIPLPSLPEQKRIAAILDKADAIRRKRQQAIQLADEFLRAVFLDMFGDPVTNPKGWDSLPLGELITDGPTNGLYKPSTKYGEGVDILRIDGFYDGYLTCSERKQVRVSSAELERYRLANGAIVINRVNSREYLGKCALVEGINRDTVFESNMMVFRVDESRVDARFLVDQMRSAHVRRQILTRSKDAVNQASINQKDVKSLEVRVPPFKQQTLYSTLVGRVNALKQKYTSSTLSTEETFNSISQGAFAGDL